MLPVVVLLLMVGTIVLGTVIFLSTGGSSQQDRSEPNAVGDWGLVAVVVVLALVFPMLAWRRTSIGRAVDAKLWRAATVTGTVLLTLATLTMTATMLTSSTMVVIGGVLAAGWYLAYVWPAWATSNRSGWPR